MAFRSKGSTTHVTSHFFVRQLETKAWRSAGAIVAAISATAAVASMGPLWHSTSSN